MLVSWVAIELNVVRVSNASLVIAADKACAAVTAALPAPAVPAEPPVADEAPEEIAPPRIAAPRPRPCPTAAAVIIIWSFTETRRL